LKSPEEWHYGRKNRGDEPIWVIIHTYIHTWKCHKKTPCLAILDKHKKPFFLNRNREQKGRTSPVLGVGTSGEGG
jgi:hypothetical protein